MLCQFHKYKKAAFFDYSPFYVIGLEQLEFAAD
jgi:hypothetical protein